MDYTPPIGDGVWYSSPMYCISHVRVHFDYLQAAHRIVSTHLYHPQLLRTSHTQTRVAVLHNQHQTPTPSTNNTQYQLVQTLTKQHLSPNAIMYHLPPFYHVLEAQEANATPACTRERNLPGGTPDAQPPAGGSTLPAHVPAKEPTCPPAAPADHDPPARPDQRRSYCVVHRSVNR